MDVRVVHSHILDQISAPTSMDVLAVAEVYILIKEREQEVKSNYYILFMLSQEPFLFVCFFVVCGFFVFFNCESCNATLMESKNKK